jgi:hypothetical protein
MRIILFFIGIVMLFGCEKSADRNCFKSTGEVSVKEIELGEFSQLYMGPHLKYVLVQSTENKLKIVGGKNVINFVEPIIEGEVLKINNLNKCNFLRSYGKSITVYIYFKDVYNITFEGTEEVTCLDRLNFQNLFIAIRDGAGEFNLSVNANSLQMLVTHGWGNFNLDGEVNYLKLEVRSNGFCNTNALTVNDSISVISKSSELVKLNADNCFLRAETASIGDVWYIGTPTSIIHHNTGVGSLLDKN